jgi:5-methylcytosine-specific restriction protein A
MKFTEKVRETIRKRADNRCEVCGSLAQYHQIHHRRPRGMGGSKDPAVGSAANGLWVHPGCHTKIESYRDQAYMKGYLVHQSHDPAKIPVKIGMFWYLLDENGGRSLVKDPHTAQ